jgi:hypothetical protein
MKGDRFVEKKINGFLTGELTPFNRSLQISSGNRRFGDQIKKK